jgi:hypothetical protein
VPPPGYVPPPDAGGASAPIPAPVRRPPQRYVSHRLIVTGVALAAAVIAVFVALGSTSNQALDPIAQAATVSAHAPGYKMELSYLITSSQLDAPITASGSAVVDPPDHAASMSLTMQVPQGALPIGGSTLQMGMVLDGQDVYLKLPQALAGRLPGLGAKPWIEVNAAKASGLPGLSSLGDSSTSTDPGEMLQELRANAASVTNEGQQLVGGVQTTHYLAEFNLDQFLPNLPSSEQALLQKLIQNQNITVDVWIDSHHLVRRMVLLLALSLGGGPSLQENVTANFSDYGPQPRPTPPPASQVTDASSLAGLSS